jgi:hypothetical protein
VELRPTYYYKFKKPEQFYLTLLQHRDYSCTAECTFLKNLKNIRRETSRHFRNKKREYLKDKIEELAMNSKNKNIRERGYQPRSN